MVGEQLSQTFPITAPRERGVTYWEQSARKITQTTGYNNHPRQPPFPQGNKKKKNRHGKLVAPEHGQTELEIVDGARPRDKFGGISLPLLPLKSRKTSEQARAQGQSTFTHDPRRREREGHKILQRDGSASFFSAARRASSWRRPREDLLAALPWELLCKGEAANQEEEVDEGGAEVGFND